MCKHDWLYSTGLYSTGLTEEPINTTLLHWQRRCLRCDKLQYLLKKYQYQEPCYVGR